VIDLPSATTTDGHVGVQWLGGRFFVSARRRNALANHRVHVLDEQGQLIPGQSFDQPLALAPTAWGLRDLTTDGVSLFGCSELGVFGFDTAGAPAASIVTANGSRAFVGPIGGGALARLGTIRALAYDPAGNGGEGSFWGANLESELIEFDLAGNVLVTHANRDRWCIQGLALDPCAATLWAFAAPDRGPVVEIDPATGRTTGRTIDAFVRGAQGGLCTFVDGVARRLAWIAQGERDLLVVATLHTVDGLCAAPTLVSSVDGGPSDRSFKVTDDAASMLTLALTGSVPARPAVLFVNLGADALSCGDVTWVDPSWMTLGDLRATTGFSVPSGIAVELPTTTGTPISVPLTVLPANTPLRVQAVWLEPAVAAVVPGALAVVPSNEVEIAIERRARKGVLVTATGYDSAIGDPKRGFFAIRHDGADPIRRVVLEAVGGMVFDYDQETSNGTPWAGNSSAGGACVGTWRLGSDVAAGLDYAVTPPAGCDSTARRGFLETGEGGETLTFSFAGGLFANGVTFAFDCDTDGGKGPTGRDVDGMVVRVTFASGEVRTAVLRADASGAMRASATL
jgi:hypothetical protein